MQISYKEGNEFYSISRKQKQTQLNVGIKTKKFVYVYTCMYFVYVCMNDFVKLWQCLPFGPTLASSEWSCNMSSSLGGDSLLAEIRIWNNIPVPPLETNTPTLRPLPNTEKKLNNYNAMDIHKYAKKNENVSQLRKTIDASPNFLN